MATRTKAKLKPLCSWDNVPEREGMLFTAGNVNEVLPGMTRPLYADLAKWWDYHWNTIVAEDLGVRDLLSIEPPPRFNQLGFLGGRWAISVSFNMAMTATWTPSGESSMLQSFFEGGDQIVASALDDSARALAAYAIYRKRIENAVALRKREEKIARSTYAASRKRRHHALTDRELVDLIEENTLVMGQSFSIHYYITVGGGDGASRLGAELDKYFKKRPAEWVTKLTSGLRNVESARPGKAIWDLSRLVAGRKSLANDISLLSSDQIVTRLAAPPDADWAAFAEAWRAFVAEFGWRGQRESDPSTPTWDESPAFVLSQVKAEMAAPASANPYTREERAAREREKLERRIFARIPKAELPAFKRELALTQVLAREREAVKACWAREARNFRPPVLELGRRWAAKGLIDDREDIWFLRWDEVQEAVKNGLDGKAAKKAIASRKAEYERLSDFTMPDGVFEWPADLVAQGGAIDAKQRVFTALAVSPGVATGRARVIMDAYDDAHIEPGEILVAPVTDAPWTPLFIPAAAVVVEVGGVLSHAATVAREFGIPAVSGVKDATRIIKTGQLITVDGNTGTVTIVSG